MTIVTYSTKSISQGFVLVATLWFLVAITLFVGFIALEMEKLQQQTFGAEAEIVQKFDQLAVESGLLYLAATRSFSYAGIRTRPVAEVLRSNDAWQTVDHFAPDGSELRLDGRTYVLRGDFRVRLQDAGSLVSLRSDDLVVLRRLLEQYQPDASERERLISTLTDYLDRDDSPLVNGAEARAYNDRGILSPTNRFLSTPYQLYNVFGWSDFLNDNPRFFDEVTIYVADTENFNTMTRNRLLQTRGLNADDVDRIVEFRKDGVFGSIGEVNEVSGTILQIDPLAVSLVPSHYLRIQILTPDRKSEEWLGITLTAAGGLAPFEIDYRLNLTPGQKEDIYVADTSYQTSDAPTILLQ